MIEVLLMLMLMLLEVIIEVFFFIIHGVCWLKVNTLIILHHHFLLVQLAFFSGAEEFIAVGLV